MRSKDYKPSKVVKCLKCGRSVLGISGRLCVHCKSSAPKFILKNSSLVKLPRCYPAPIPSPYDISLLDKLGGGALSGLHLYIKAHQKRLGRCSKCRKLHSTLRVTPYNNGRGVKSLLCEKCFKGNKAAVVKPMDWTKDLWRRSDPLMRMLLSSSKTFQEALASRRD
jgi:hypothetical protein